MIDMFLSFTSLTSWLSQSVLSWFYVLQSNKKELQALKDREAQFLLELNKAQQEIHKLRLNLIAGVGHYEATVWLPPSGSRSLRGHCLTSLMWGGHSLWSHTLWGVIHYEATPYWGLVNMSHCWTPLNSVQKGLGHSVGSSVLCCEVQRHTMAIFLSLTLREEKSWIIVACRQQNSFWR